MRFDPERRKNKKWYKKENKKFPYKSKSKEDRNIYKL
jgi:hypothetical protein